VGGSTADAGNGGSGSFGQHVRIGAVGHAPDDTEAPPPTIVSVRYESDVRADVR
jgi:hypothetical protein